MRTFLCLLLAFAAFAARGFSAEPVLIDGIAAKVNEQAITMGDVLVRIQPIRRKLASRYSGEDLRQKMMEAYQEELDALIERQIILDAYDKQEGRIPEWMVEKRINEIIHETFHDKRDALMAALAEDKLTYAEWREDIQQQLIVASMKQNSIQRHVSVSVADIRRVYERLPDKYKTDMEVKLGMIVLKKPADEAAAAQRLKDAEALRQKILDGADFGEAAKLHSQDPKADKGGDWGWVKAGDLREELKDAVIALPNGGITKVIDTDREIYLAKIEDCRGKGDPGFEDVREEIEKDLKKEEAESLYKQWTDSLRKEAYIKIYDVNPFAR